MPKLSSILIAALALAACSKADPGAGSAGSGGAATSLTGRDAVLDAWKSAKLTPSALAPATVAFAKDCQSGTIEGLDVLVCSFASAADAKAAEQPAQAWIGATTGAAQAHGAALIVVADRKKADPNGKTINRLMKLAPK